MDGTSLDYTFDHADTPTTKSVQFFDNNGSRAIYQDGWMACTFGPFIPWNTPASVPRVAKWNSATDEWELYKISDDFSQAKDLAKEMPDKLAEMKTDFLKLALGQSAEPLAAGKHTVEIMTDITGPGKAGTASVRIDGKDSFQVPLKRTVPAAFTATESFDVGADLGSPISMNYYDRRPFEFEGTIKTVKVDLTK